MENLIFSWVGPFSIAMFVYQKVYPILLIVDHKKKEQMSKATGSQDLEEGQELSGIVVRVVEESGSPWVMTTPGITAYPLVMTDIALIYLLKIVIFQYFP